VPPEPKHPRRGDRQVAERQFIDRQEFVAPVQSALKEPPRTKPLVLVFHGGAGIGKSRLRRELVRQLARDPEVLAATLDFDVVGHRHPETALFFLRNTLCQTSQVCFPSFDLAYAVYWQKTHPDTALAVSGNSNSETRMTNEISALMQERNSLLSQLLDESGKLSLIGLIPKIAKLVAASLDPSIPRSLGPFLSDWWERRGERELEDIPQMEPGEIVDHLPKLWANDLKHYLGAASLKPQAPSREEGGERREDSQVRNDERRTTNEERGKRRAVLFIDSYEKLWDIGMAEADFFKRDEWLRELVTELPEVLWVICGRQKLRWEEKEADWSKALSQHQLEPLPEKSARRFLESCDITDEPTQDAIVKGSRGLPHYLDIAVDAMQSAKGKAQKAEFKGENPDEVVEEFTRRLDKPEVDTLSVLSATRFWYYGLFENLVTQYRTGYPLSGYDDLARFSFIKDGAAPGTRTMHELMREALQENQPPELRTSVHRFLYEYYAKQLAGVKETYVGEQHRSALIEAFYHARQAMNAEELWNAMKGPTTPFYDTDQYRVLTPIYREMAERLEAEFGPANASFGAALIKLACMVRIQEDFEQVEPMLRRALAIVDKELGPDHEKTLECMNELVKLMNVQGRHDEEEVLGRRMVELFDRPGQEAAYRQLVLSNLGVALTYQNKLAEAEEVLSRALAICESDQGPDKWQHAMVLHNLAGVLEKQARFTEAELLARRTLEMQEDFLGPNHPDLAWGLAGLGRILARLGRYVEAEPLAWRNLKLKEATRGPEHAEAATATQAVAFVLSEQGRLVEAEQMARRALAAQEKKLVPDHPLTRTTADTLAVILTKQGRFDEAEPIVTNAVAVSEQKRGPEHPATATALHTAGVVYNGQGRYAEAESCLRRSLDIRTKALGPESIETLRTLDELALLEERRGRPAEAEKIYRDVMEKRERVQGAEHPDVATTANRLAGICARDGRYAEAEPLYRRALAIREKVFGQDHQFVAETLEGLAKVCEQTGRAAEAQELAARAKAIREKNAAAAQAQASS